MPEQPRTYCLVLKRKNNDFNYISPVTNILPKYAIKIAASKVTTTQMIATVALFFIMEGFSMDINLTII